MVSPVPQSKLYFPQFLMSTTSLKKLFALYHILDSKNTSSLIQSISTGAKTYKKLFIFIDR